MRKQLLKLLYFTVFFQFYCLLCFPKHVAVIRENVMGVRDKLEEAERRVEESGEDFEVGYSKLFGIPYIRLYRVRSLPFNSPLQRMLESLEAAADEILEQRIAQLHQERQTLR